MRVSGKASPDNEAFVYLSKLCLIDSEVLILLRDPELSRPLPLAFTFFKVPEASGADQKYTEKHQPSRKSICRRVTLSVS